MQGDLVSIPGSERSPREGNGNPLQYSCLENPMDREAWQTTVHRVAKELEMTERLNDNNTTPMGPLRQAAQWPLLCSKATQYSMELHREHVLGRPGSEPMSVLCELCDPDHDA